MKLPWNHITQALRRNAVLAAALCLGLVLLLWPQSPQERGEELPVQSWDEEIYVQRLEERLSTALSRIDGAGRVSTVLTWERSSRRELAADEKGEERETVVVSAGSGREETVVVQESAPRLRGALVVCPGGGDPQVRLNLLRSVMALTGLRANEISICQGGRTE